MEEDKKEDVVTPNLEDDEELEEVDEVKKEQPKEEQEYSVENDPEI